MRKKNIVILCSALVLMAVAINILIVKTAPRAERKRPPKTAPLVETQRLEATDHTVVLQLTGTVVPAEETVVRARVSGEVVSIAPDFVEGGLIAKGSDILRIDPTDYELALANAQSALETARFNYKLELGRQDIARREWELLETDEANEQERELALRIPHLAASKAALKAAEARLKQARLDLQRTHIRVPFNAVVLERMANLGTLASPQNNLARLAGTDAYWVQVSIPVDRIGWVDIPGSPATVHSSSEAKYQGRVIKLLGDLEEKGRMARLLLEVQDPLGLTPVNAGKKPLLLGEYVRAEISGRKLDKVFTIPRQALRENSCLWIARPDGKLDIRKIKVLWRNAHNVVIQNGITDGELLIISDLTTPIDGMDINTGARKSEKTHGEPRGES
jgi:RND family efflux transporter MFP subunit